MEQALVVLAILAVIGAVAFAVKYFTRDPVWYKNPIDRANALLKTTPTVTQEGIKVYYESKAGKINHAAVDAGVRECIRRVACKYPFDRNRHNIKICVLEGEIAPESRLPAFRVAIGHASPYFNSEWDMMKGSKKGVHYILAAGQMASADFQAGDVLVIPSGGDDQFYKNICDYEFEHVALAYYDGDEFERTKIHGSGTGHPIIPDTCFGGAVGLAAPRPMKVLCLDAHK